MSVRSGLNVTRLDAAKCLLMLQQFPECIDPKYCRYFQALSKAWKIIDHRCIGTYQSASHRALSESNANTPELPRR